MACGCGKNGARAQQAARQLEAAAPPPAGAVSAARVAVYQLVKDGEVILTTESPVAARQEAKRLRASVRVSSRKIEKKSTEAEAPAAEAEEALAG